MRAALGAQWRDIIDAGLAAMELGAEKERVRQLGEIIAEHNRLFGQKGKE